MMNKEPLPTPWMNAAAVLLLAAIVVHSMFLAVYNLPFNYVTGRLGIVATAYVDPYFNQAWGFFAPDPGGAFNDVLFRFARVENGTRVETGPWMRGRDALPAAVEYPNNPLSSVRAIYFGAEMVSIKHVADLRALARARTETARRPLAVDELPLATRPLARVLMSVGCRTAPVRGCADYQLQIAFEERRVPRFAERFMNVSKRSTSKPPTIFMLPWVQGEAIASAVDAFDITPTAR